jgi:multidrug efflux pump subunit AcrB
MGPSSPVLSDQQFAVGRALVGSVILQEGMQRRMKEQRSSKRRPHKATLEAYYMLFLASVITLAVFTSIGLGCER